MTFVLINCVKGNELQRATKKASAKLIFDRAFLVYEVCQYNFIPSATLLMPIAGIRRAPSQHRLSCFPRHEINSLLQYAVVKFASLQIVEGKDAFFSDQALDSTVEIAPPKLAHALPNLV